MTPSLNSKCGSCGVDVPTDAVFCPGCGASLAPNATLADPLPSEEPVRTSPITAFFDGISEFHPILFIHSRLRELRQGVLAMVALAAVVQLLLDRSYLRATTAVAATILLIDFLLVRFLANRASDLDPLYSIWEKQPSEHADTGWLWSSLPERTGRKRAMIVGWIACALGCGAALVREVGPFAPNSLPFEFLNILFAVGAAALVVAQVIHQPPPAISDPVDPSDWTYHGPDLSAVQPAPNVPAPAELPKTMIETPQQAEEVALSLEELYPDIARIIRLVARWNPRRGGAERDYQRWLSRRLRPEFGEDSVREQQRLQYKWGAGRPDFIVRGKSSQVLLEIKAKLRGTSEANRAIGQIWGYAQEWRSRGPTILLVCAPSENRSDLVHFINDKLSHLHRAGLPILPQLIVPGGGTRLNVRPYG